MSQNLKKLLNIANQEHSYSMPHQSHRQPSFIKLLTVSLLLSLSNFSTPSQAKDLNSMDMERSAYEIVRRHGREGEGRAAEGKPLM